MRFHTWLYQTWSENVASADTSLSSLLDRNAPFVQHGVHTYETIRVPLWLASATGREDLGRASRNALEKLSRYTEPGGSAVSQELISNLAPDPTSTEYEYCATKEAQLTLQSALQKTGVASLGDRVERVWFNDAQGARTADGRAIAYFHKRTDPAATDFLRMEHTLSLATSFPLHTRMWPSAATQMPPTSPRSSSVACGCAITRARLPRCSMDLARSLFI